jgi:Na+/H+ antiporter NhaD/arsenite permease-like protein
MAVCTTILIFFTARSFPFHRRLKFQAAMAEASLWSWTTCENLYLHTVLLKKMPVETRKLHMKIIIFGDDPEENFL